MISSTKQTMMRHITEDQMKWKGCVGGVIMRWNLECSLGQRLIIMLLQATGSRNLQQLSKQPSVQLFSCDGIIIFLCQRIMPSISLESLRMVLDDHHLRIRNIEVSRYFVDLICALWNTVYKGYFFDSESLLKEIHLVIQSEPDSISERVMAEVYLMECQLWIKRKKKDRFTYSRSQLIRHMEQMDETQLTELVGRYNHLILFDQKIQVIEPCESEVADIIKLSDEGNIKAAIRELKALMPNYPQQLQTSLRILLGKLYLLESNIEALGQFSDIAQHDQLVYESYSAKLLMIAGYKSLQKLNIDTSKYKEQYQEYGEYVKKYSNEEINQNIAKLENIFKEINKCDIPSEKMVHIEAALDLTSSLPCYPSPSVVELDLHLLTITAKYNQNQLAEAKKFVERCKSTAQKLGILSGSRESKIDYKLALILEKEKKVGQALNLVERCIRLEFKEKELIILHDMRERLQKSKSSLRNSMINEESEEGEEVEEVKQIKQVKKMKKVTAKPIPSDQTAEVSSAEENVELPQPPKNTGNCCLLF